jgi:UPF0755 protein
MNNVFHTFLTVFLLLFLYILASLGYLFYLILLMVRAVQNRLLKLSVVLLFLLLSLATASLGYIFYYPKESIGSDVKMEIERGTSLYSICNTLSDSGVVRDGKILYYYLRLFSKGSNIKAGSYLIAKNSGLVNLLPQFETPLNEDVSVTIPEGINIWSTAQIFSRDLNIDSAKFVDLATDTIFVQKLGIKGAKTVEGYLYPETYFFPENSSAEDVIKLMVSYAKNSYASINSSWVTEKFTNLQILSLASVVEDEAQAAHERARISAVFHNRLKRGIPLGADATVRYSIKKFTGPLRVSELNNNSPYNTRKFKGIPPGPICSPGIAAIEATIHPLETDELFFVAKWDGSGEHSFSSTNSEHNRKKMAIRKNNRDKQNW